jgi:DNA-binding response OmpR family regulator
VEYIVAVLRDNGFATCTAADGAQAYDLLKEERPSLITLDLEMEEEWGTKFYRKLSKEAQFKDIPVIVISGLSGRHLSIKKAVGYLGKPFEPDELLCMIRKSIGD